MTWPARRGGNGLVELVVALALALAVLTMVTAAVGTGGRLLLGASARGEAEDIVQLAVEALVFDVRHAGFDPAGAGFEAITEAYADHVTVQADLDASGAVDTSSSELTTFVCGSGATRLSRIVGRQSLPLAENLRRCVFRYLDRNGIALMPPPTGLAPADRARIRAVELSLTMRPAGIAGTDRTALVAVRRAT